MPLRRNWKSEWTIPEGVTYLNHGSFGPAPRMVQQAAEEWSRRLESQPMDFYLRQMEPALDAALERLAAFVGTSRGNLTFVDNATVGMNIVAASVSLNAGDEVLLTDHEYGAVMRVWKRACQKAGARVVIVDLPQPLDDPTDVTNSIMAAVTDRTRLIVVSHVTSPTAVVLPVADVCKAARERGVPVCIDGPHAIAMLPVDLKKLDCDFYTASCHKWLSAPCGSGFLFVHPRQQKQLEPIIVSWGGSVGGFQPDWQDEYVWLGTRNPAAFLAVPAAIEFLARSSGDTGLPVLDEYRQHSQRFVAAAIRKIAPITKHPLLVADVDRWCGSMLSFPLRPLSEPLKQWTRDPLQNALWDRHRIEIPVVHWKGQRLIRVSAHLYNDESDIDLLASVLPDLLREFP